MSSEGESPQFGARKKGENYITDSNLGFSKQSPVALPSQRVL